MVARREWTRAWWEQAKYRDELVTSVPVLDELRQGAFAAREECLRLLDSLQLVPVEHAVMDIVQAYIEHRLMPKDPVGDALHLALASHHRCDFLVTWNCKHLANANASVHGEKLRRTVFVPGVDLLRDKEACG